MSERIHDDEPDTSERVVRSLLAAQMPTLADAPLLPLSTSGTSNAMWRVDAGDLRGVVRLPRTDNAAASVARENELLPWLWTSSIRQVVDTPRVLHAGEPTVEFGHPWAVLDWIDGTDAWEGRNALDEHALADRLAEVYLALHVVRDAPAPDRSAGRRGGPLGPLLDRLVWWLDDPQWEAASLIDVAAVRRLADAGRELVGEPVPRVFLHGDLIPGNLVLRDGRLHAVIDWGGAGHGDPADDLAPAWAVLQAPARRRFRDALGCDEATWRRGMLFSLEQAVGGSVYYRPRRHPLGEVSARTLDRILDDAASSGGHEVT